MREEQEDVISTTDIIVQDVIGTLVCHNGLQNLFGQWMPYKISQHCVSKLFCLGTLLFSTGNYTELGGSVLNIEWDQQYERSYKYYLQSHKYVTNIIFRVTRQRIERFKQGTLFAGTNSAKGSTNVWPWHVRLNLQKIYFRSSRYKCTKAENRSGSYNFVS